MNREYAGGDVALDLVVQYAISGSATPGLDYTALAGVVVIPEGEVSTTVLLSAVDDFLVETNEMVVVTILPDSSYNGAGSSASLSIVDDDPTTVTVTATDNTARESGGSSATFTVTRQGSLAPNLAVAYVLSGTASNGSDFAALSGTVTIPAGKATATITLTPINDAVVA